MFANDCNFLVVRFCTFLLDAAFKNNALHAAASQIFLNSSAHRESLKLESHGTKLASLHRPWIDNHNTSIGILTIGVLAHTDNIALAHGIAAVNNKSNVHHSAVAAPLFHVAS